MDKKRAVNLKSHHVKDDKDVNVLLTVTFFLFSDSDLMLNPEKYHEERATIQKYPIHVSRCVHRYM